MGLFGRRRKGDSARPARYPDSLDVRSADDVDWIKSSEDPLVWHDAALACLIFAGDPHGLVPWLAGNPMMDRVTAAAIFLHGSNGARHLAGEPVEHLQIDPDAVVTSIERLCELDRSHELKANGIAMMQGWEDERLVTFERIAADPRAPRRFLATPIPATGVPMPYLDIGEGELTSRDYLRREMPFMLDE